MGLSLRETRVCRGSKVSSRCLRSLSRSFCGVLASVELLKNGGGFTTLSKVPVPSGSCERIQLWEGTAARLGLLEWLPRDLKQAYCGLNAVYWQWILVQRF